MYLYNLFCISKAASEYIFPGQIIQPLSTKRRGCFRVNKEKKMNQLVEISTSIK